MNKVILKEQFSIHERNFQFQCHILQMFKLRSLNQPIIIMVFVSHVHLNRRLCMINVSYNKKVAKSHPSVVGCVEQDLKQRQKD